MTRARPRVRAAAAIAAVLVAGVVVALATEALARPGGGSSFSGGSSSRSSSRSSGGGGGGGGGGELLIDLFAFIFRLCWEAPAIGIPLLVVLCIVVAGVAIAKSRNAGLADWVAGDGGSETEPPSARPVRPRVRPRLEELRATDENFSIVLFEDFLAALYVEVHAARGKQALATLSAYITPSVQANLTSLGLVQVRDILVGAMRFVRVDLGAPDPEARVRVEVEFETNYTEVSIGSKQQAFYARERWRLARRRGVLSRTPDRARVFPCPSCGAPLDQVIAGVCRHCGQNVSTGAFDWVVEEAALLARETRGPMLTGTTEERGTDFPTEVDDDVQLRLRALSAKDPSFDWNAFQARVGLIFSSFQMGWATRDLAPMRPFFTDNLFYVQAFWIDAYKRQHLRNITERARITGLHLARVTSDKFFDAITIRLFATSLDYTVSDAGALVSGSKSRERPYSEYWTLMRGTARKGPTRAEPVCPNCGAPLAVNMAGTCQYCQAKVCSGEFDWVLSRIEQDETYEG